MKVEILREVQEWLRTGIDAKYNRKFNMNNWFDTATVAKERNWCGTTCCIAGFIMSNHVPVESVLKSVLKSGSSYAFVDGEYRFPDDFAFEILGADLDTSEYYALQELFIPPVSSDYIKWSEITPEMAIQAIDNLIEHGEPKWTEIEGFMKNE